MVQAFRNLGHEVVEVTGYAAQRRDKIREVRKALADGVKFDLVYSESSTMPTVMTEKNHLPMHPFLDSLFLCRMRKNGVPVGLFYRDIYWRFPEYGKDLPWWKKWSAIWAYRYDLQWYKSAVDVLFLPSVNMAPYVYKHDFRYAQLPPGHESPEVHHTPSSPLRLFYVGAIGVHYDMADFIRAVGMVPEAELTICCREDEWQRYKNLYQPLGDNIRVVHKGGDELIPEYNRCNVAALLVAPSEYRMFASPMKLYEYLGRAKPVLCTNGTLSAQFVTTEGYGWAIDYSVEDIVAKLQYLAAHPEEIDAKHEAAVSIRERHTWEARAQQVIAELTGRS